MAFFLRHWTVSQPDLEASPNLQLMFEAGKLWYGS